MSIALAQIFAALCGVVILFQLALAGGAPWGALTQGGRVDGPLPPSGRIVAALSAAALAWMAATILSAAGIGLGWPRWTGWATVGLLLLSATLNWVSPSAAERALWGPVGTAMTALAAMVMVVSTPQM